MRYLEISKHSSISPNDLINSINKANLTPPLQVLYNNHNDVFYFEFAHSIDAIEALKWCDKWVRLVGGVGNAVGGSNGDQVQSQVHSEQHPQPHSLNQHSSTGPPVGSILNPLIVTHSDPISPPLSPKSPKSPNSSLSTFNASPPQNLFDVLASLPGANANTVNKANTTQSIHTPHRTQTPNNSLPPILNTGSQGPMQMQPGDWVCSCGFVNWRRRKSCYRCYPFANGNESGSSNNGELARAAQKAAQLAEEGLSESQDNQDIHNTQDTHNDSAFAFDTHLLNVGLGRLELNQLDHHPHHPEHPTLDYRTFLASRKAWDSGNDGGFNGGGGGGSVGVDHNAHDTFDQLGEILQRVQSSR
ncbi:hypothetical protein E3P81_01946 [Wallemia ichthyophaga]|nr:hypothetical protein E3P97_01945 [Wallemia ichthyophaga]TIB32893.1 hypothetical protein E3P85_01578 [Wallemia ichthyophaga]TIB46819.1 hypothetical protein E3P82_01943 [Wallemia ichthyophaga]TIB51135.1 hypothetical protein E3P81_01946 [Wallemia ichthyophaga]TIB53806.1 hypothetical protein E3P80_01944 [Wallemia ichthyophaga]